MVMLVDSNSSEGRCDVVCGGKIFAYAWAFQACCISCAAWFCDAGEMGKGVALVVVSSRKQRRRKRKFLGEEFAVVCFARDTREVKDRPIVKTRNTIECDCIIKMRSMVSSIVFAWKYRGGVSGDTRVVPVF